MQADDMTPLDIGATGASPPFGRRDELHDALLRPDEAAELLAVKPSWVYEAVRGRRLPCVRVGRHIRFTRAMLNDWIAEQSKF
jgi:excisionase family DNA binding protein